MQQLVARVLIASLFIGAAWAKGMNLTGTTAYFGRLGLPARWRLVGGRPSGDACPWPRGVCAPHGRAGVRQGSEPLHVSRPRPRGP